MFPALRLPPSRRRALTASLVVLALAWAGLAGSGMLPPVASSAAAATPVTTAHAVHAGMSGPGQTPADGHYCDGCQPPLSYSGGPVLDTSGDAGVTITPIYWAPAAAAPFPEGYQATINGYIGDVAADSGTDGNIFSIASEYYQVVDGVTSRLDYLITAGEPIVDTAPFPRNGCDRAEGYRSCITDAQIRTELKRVLVETGSPTGRAHFYPVFFGPGVETEDRDGTTSADAFCGYHRSYGTGAKQVFYGNEPYAETDCDGGQAPNGSLAVDGAIGTLSHEIMEALTDPDENIDSWLDDTGNEIADVCSGDYGTALGSTDDSDPQHTEYNQLINGTGYYTQTEFSNSAFDAYGVGNGCAQSEAEATTDPASRAASVSDITSYATPNGLRADGTSTSLIEDSIGDSDGNSVVGDFVSFSTYAVTGDGACGTLSAVSATTDADGIARVTYTASEDDVVCAVVALEARGGRSSTATMFQGSYRASAPKATATFPASIAVGEPMTFTTTFTNPSKKPIAAARITLDIFPATDRSRNVDASQITLFASQPGSNGRFTRVTLTGSTRDEGVIEGGIGRLAGVTIPAHSSYTVSYRITLARRLSIAGTAPQLSFEAYLDQVNAASGSTSNLADTLATDVRMVAPGPWFPPGGTILATILATVAVASLIVIALVLAAVRRRRRDAS